ncbi:MAG TPA: N-acetylmuramoyl-L-alanine amidase CwlD [Firmicutes bacterium]|nr:N-acetylmuramoyl-L-alanine amidase CwlD [Candidatus Fermentithermobacillaceae bacterium]
MARRRGARRRRRPFFYVTSARAAIFGILLLAVLVGSGVFSRAIETATPAGPLKGQVIYLDPGHGGIDPGACGATVVEKDVVLQVALYLGVKLERSGARVVYSRTGDYDLESEDVSDVRARIDLIESSGATMVISLHCNAFTDPYEYGAQTFYNAQRHPESQRLAEIIQKELAENTDTYREASARIDHFMLNASGVPAATVELGFLSNPHEETLLGSASYRQKLAEVIWRAVIQFVETEQEEL